MASQPRINSTLVAAIRMAKKPNKPVTGGPSKIYTFVHNQDRPDKAYTTERAKKKGKANAASGKIFVTLPPDHFGPILAEHDPERNQGVLVGESWEGRLECRQWGLHYPPVAGIAGQSQYGAQSVVLSGGYEDDEDHGEWFLYTGSGGRDLSGNKRTNRSQSFDQKFLKLNEALRVSCKKGYPVRVVRSCKEKRSSYAPEKGLRYDGIYRIEECWRKIGVQGFKVCRYLFVRCDNDPAPWTSDDHGDWPRPLPEIPELVTAVDITKRKESASWDFDEVDSCWKWTKPPPLSRVVARAGKSDGKKSIPIRVKLLREFGCFICKQVMAQPVTTPCAHNFCKLCLEATFSGQCFVRERSRGGRALRSQRTIMKCPSCTNDISDFLKEPQVNRELMEVIESLKQKTEEDKEPPEELNDDEETDASEGLSDHGPASSETSETNVAAGSDKPTAKCKSGRPSKRKKVGSLGTDNDKEETSIVVEKPDGFDVDSGSGEVQAGNFEVGKKDKRAEETMEEENDSPSSPLLVLSDGQDSA